MGSVNKVILIGHLGADPELRQTKTGADVASLSLATSESWRDAAGQRQDKTEWHRVSVFGAQAQPVAQYLKKGSLCSVEGSLETREWTDRDGGKRRTTEVKAHRVTFLDSAQGQGGRSARPASPRPAADPPPPSFDPDDDLPF